MAYIDVVYIEVVHIEQTDIPFLVETVTDWLLLKRRLI